MAVGNTGCGKSTMMTSLMFGPETLEVKKGVQEIEVPLVGGGLKKKKIKTPIVRNSY